MCHNQRTPSRKRRLSCLDTPLAICYQSTAMDRLWNMSLIHLLDFYFALMFCAGTWRRFRQYQTMGRLAFAGPGRWPHLLTLIHGHRTLFLTWQTVAPAALAFLVLVVQMTASRLVWPEAGRPPHGLELHDLFAHWPCLFAVIPLGAAMLAFDLWGFIVVGQIDRPAMEKYFDQAEYWLRSPAAHFVKFGTFGFLNPRKIVAVEVRKALEAASGLVNYTLWWIVTQTILRFAFGLSLWLTWALAVL